MAAEKLRRATPHWMRHSHASHASIATTSMYLHGDELERTRQMRHAFGARHAKRQAD